MRRWQWLIWIPTLALAGSCSKPKAEAQEQPKSETGDPVIAQLQTVVDNCVIDVRAAQIRNCKTKDHEKLITNYRGGQMSPVKALPTLVQVMEGADEKQQVVAADLLHEAYRYAIADAKPEDIPAALATKMIELLPKLRRPLAVQMAPATVHAAMLAKQDEALYKMLDAQVTHVRSSAYSHIQEHGGPRIASKLSQLLKDDDVLGIAVLKEAERRLMQADKPSKEMCDLAKEFLSDKREAVTESVAPMAGLCSGEYAEALVAEVTKRSEDKTLTRGIVRPTSMLCEHMSRQQTQTLTSEQCVKLRELLEQIIDDEEQTLDTRQAAMSSLAHQFHDDKTLELITKYKDHEFKPLRINARNLIRVIEQDRLAGTK